MQRIHDVAILGAGALGAFYAMKFRSAPEVNVSLIADGERGARLRAEGLSVNGETFRLPVHDPRQTAEPADLIIVALKHHQLPPAIESLRHFVGENTLILSVMNGLDSEEMIAARYGWDKVLYCVAVGIDGVRDGSSVMVAHAGRLCFGETLNRPAAARVVRVQEALEHAGLPWETPEDMLRMLWWKFMINVGINQTSAVLRAPYGVFQRSADARAVVATLMEEVIALARCRDIDLGPADLEAWDRVLGNLAPEGKTSMLQDIEAGRKTEVEIFAGKMVELGRTYQVPTPANAQMLHLIRTLEGTA
ncbi:MAG TPA: 2-dehydropantoate 2-reductase [Desulfuromonadales bacterium]|nr:2-dehydropantoate 2-reductase [Desulfuromonadales bacterium]